MAQPNESTSTLTPAPKRKASRQEVTEDPISDLELALSEETLNALATPGPCKIPTTIVDRSTYPAEAKALYLKLKNLSTNKVSKAAHMKETKTQLKEGKFPACVNFKCPPYGARGDLEYIANWASITAICKRDLTLLYLGKNEISLTTLALEGILDDDQF
jgi:hypothetical protein